MASKIHMQVVAVKFVCFRSKHSGKSIAGSSVNGTQERRSWRWCGTIFNHPVIGKCNRSAIGQFEPGNIKRIGKAVFRDLAIGEIVAPAAVIAGAAGDLCHWRCERISCRLVQHLEPVRKCCCHAAIELWGRFEFCLQCLAKTLQ